jgi:hypothetical protein
MMHRLESQASDVGVRIITLASSVTALRFYRSLGYRSDGPPVTVFGILCHPMAKVLKSMLAGRQGKRW